MNLSRRPQAGPRLHPISSAINWTAGRLGLFLRGARRRKQNDIRRFELPSCILRKSCFGWRSFRRLVLTAPAEAFGFKTRHFQDARKIDMIRPSGHQREFGRQVRNVIGDGCLIVF